MFIGSQSYLTPVCEGIMLLDFSRDISELRTHNKPEEFETKYKAGVEKFIIV